MRNVSAYMHATPWAKPIAYLNLYFNQCRFHASRGLFTRRSSFALCISNLGKTVC
jgi:hypothetical protein